MIGFHGDEFDYLLFPMERRRRLSLWGYLLLLPAWAWNQRRGKR